MSQAGRMPWYKEIYILFCLAVAALGLSVVGVDAGTKHQARVAKQWMMEPKIEADRLYGGQHFEGAAILYEEVRARAARATDLDVLAAVEESRRLRLLALDGLAKQRAAAAEEQARQEAEERAAAAEEQARQEAEERAVAAEEQARQEAEALAKLKEDPEYQTLLKSARDNEVKYPGIAARYYNDIVSRYAGTPPAREAEARAKSLWLVAYGSLDGLPVAEGWSWSGNLCGATLSGGKTCRNRVKEGESHCYLHANKAPSGYTTHVGPRGGTYHYSKNGKKVYSKR